MWVFALIPIIVVASVYRMIPNRCIVGINMAKSLFYGAKKMLWILCVVPVVIAIATTIFSRYTKNSNSNMQKVAVSISIFVIGYVSAIILENFDLNIIDVYNVACFSIAILFATLGSSTIIEIKNPWTMQDLNVRDKTQELACNLCIIGGLIQALSSIFLKQQKLFYVMMLTFVICLIMPNVISYVWYSKKNK